MLIDLGLQCLKEKESSTFQANSSYFAKLSFSFPGLGKALNWKALLRLPYFVVNPTINRQFPTLMMVSASP
jgi:hypothetical protein